jgi:hypothetical protein
VPKPTTGPDTPQPFHHHLWYFCMRGRIGTGLRRPTGRTYMTPPSLNYRDSSTVLLEVCRLCPSNHGTGERLYGSFSASPTCATPISPCVRGFIESRGPFFCLSEEGGPDRIRTSCNSRAGLLFAFCATKSGALAWSGCSIHIPALASAPTRPDTHKSIRSKPTDYVVGSYIRLECSDA